MLAALVLALPDIDAAPVNKSSPSGKGQTQKPDRAPRHAGLINTGDLLVIQRMVVEDL